MSPDELRGLLAVAREFGASRIRVGDVEVELRAPVQPAPTATRQEPATREQLLEAFERQLFPGPVIDG